MYFVIALNIPNGLHMIVHESFLSFCTESLNLDELQSGMLQRTIITMNECYNEQFLSIKSGCYNEHKCYNERGGILSADVAHACA